MKISIKLLPALALCLLPFSVLAETPEEKGLAIAQEAETGEILMLAYMTQEAWEATLKTGKATYWSRSRQELWVKGLTSGNVQMVKEIRIDCDDDTILLKVEQVGGAVDAARELGILVLVTAPEAARRLMVETTQPTHEVAIGRCRLVDRPLATGPGPVRADHLALHVLPHANRRSN